MNEVGVPNGNGFCQHKDCVFAGDYSHKGLNTICRYYELVGVTKLGQLPPEKRNDGNCYFYQSENGIDLDTITVPYGGIQTTLMQLYRAGKTDAELAKLFNVSPMSILRWRDKHDKKPNHKSVLVGKKRKGIFHDSEF